MPTPSSTDGPGDGGPVRGVVLDFDGTVTQQDIGDWVCDRFAPREWQDIDARWIKGELSLKEAQREMWALCRCAREEAVAYAREIGVIRPGLDRFLAAARAAGADVWLASGGFDFYIEALLGEGRLSLFARRICNAARFVDGAVEVGFPHEELACARCAICKGRLCDQARAACKGPVAFIGDGYSDRCVLDHGRADRVLAVRGSVLDRLIGERGLDAARFSDFAEAAALLFPGFTR